MESISRGQLIHHKIQAAMRDWDFGDTLVYEGPEGDDHVYIIGGEHRVYASNLEDFEPMGETEL